MTAQTAPAPAPDLFTKLRRSLTRWRIAAIVLALVALAALFSGRGGPPQRAHIARVDITGMITDDRRKLDLLDELAEHAPVKAVILAINSPGGTTTGGEAYFEAISKLAAKKPVVALQGTIATSAAYMLSLPTDRIFARSSTITGSVGVIVQFPEVSDALGRIGVKMHEIKSGDLKAAPSMFQPMTDPGRQQLEQMVAEGKAWFLGMVRDTRKIDTAAVPGLEAGGIYSGRRALEYKLIDEIGGEEAAVAWLEKAKGVLKAMPVLDRKPKPESRWDGGWLGAEAGSDAGGAGGLEGLVRRLASVAAEGAVDGAADAAFRATGTESLKLDGLLSIWHAR